MKLDFSRLGFCGRKEEFAILRQALDSTAEGKSSCVFIEGESGSGKSYLVSHSFQRLSNVVFCSGKFEEGSSREPFSAVLDAIDMLLENLLLIENDEKAIMWKEQIQTTLQSDMHRLARILPCLSDLLDSRNNVHHESTVEDGVAGEEIENAHQGGRAFDRLRFALRALLTMICSERTVVFVMDDLQWASSGCMSLIETLLDDSSTLRPRKLLFIGLHRPLSRAQAANILCVTKRRETRRIELGGLSVESLVCMISTLLQRDEDDVRSLAQVIGNKTGGNAFFVVQFLRMLEQRGLVLYSTQMFRWEWNLDRIISETDVSTNVLEFVSKKIQTLPHDQQVVLVNAACLGLSRFQSNLLFEILSSPLQMKDSTIPPKHIGIASVEDLNLSLDALVTSGFLEKICSGTYKFAHDRIREASYSTLSEEKCRQTMHLSIGRKLASLLAQSPDECKIVAGSRDNVLFQAAGQLNRGSQLVADRKEMISLARINYDAAYRAMQKASFFPALEFLEKSAFLLSSDEPWINNFDLMLKVAIAQTRCYFCCGRLEESMQLANVVFTHATSFETKRTAYHTKIICLMQENNSKEAIELVLDGLEELGERLPRRLVTFHACREILRCRRMLRGVSDEDLLRLPVIENKIMEERIHLFLRLTEITSMTGSGIDAYYPLGLLRVLQQTLKKGVTPSSITCFGCWGIISAALSNFQEAYRFGMLSVNFAKRGVGGFYDLLAFYLHYSLLAPLQRPYNESLEPVASTLKTFWTGGWIEVYFMYTPTYLWLYFLCGLDLVPLMDDVKRYAGNLRDYQSKQFYDTGAGFFQMVANLVQSDSDVPDGAHFKGEYLNQEQCLGEWNCSLSDRRMLNLNLCLMVVAFVFGEVNIAQKCADKLPPYYFEIAVPWTTLRLLYEGLVAIALSKSTGKRKHRRKGQRIISIMEKWVKMGNVNCHHMLLLLQAEQLSCSRKIESTVVRKAFDKAIVSAARLGILHNQAIASERAGEYCLSQNDKAYASHYLIQSRDLFREWGASAKVKQLEAKHNFLTATVASTSHGGKLMARTRLGDLSAQSHKALRISVRQG